MPKRKEATLFDCPGCRKPLRSLTIELSEDQVTKGPYLQLDVKLNGSKVFHGCGQKFELRSEVENTYWLVELVTQGVGR